MWSGGTVIAGGKGPVCQIAMVDRARPYVERSKSSTTGALSGVQSVIHSHVFCVGVPIRWTGALDWTTGLDYWTRVILCKSVNDGITNRPPSCVVQVASIGSLCEWI